MRYWLALIVFIWASEEDWAPVILIGVIVVSAVIDVIGGVSGVALFRSDTMQSMIGDFEEIEFDEMIHQIDTSQIPIVDEELAKKQADKKIGEEIALGSRVTLGTPALQEVNGEILWVIPLEHTGFFKWNKNKSVPGYITVSASNPNKVEFVKELDDKPLDIKYMETAYLSYDLKRHIRDEGYRNVGLTEYTFEIDDSGRPYWVITTYENKTTWTSGDATGVVIVDAQTGETNWYSVNDTPDWVDIIQPCDFIEDQIDNYGELVHGVFNFSNEDKIKKTNRTLTVYVDGDCYYFTGMTSVGSDNSCIGFVMVNTRDKKAYISYMSGATEDAAMSSAEGLVSDFGYYSTEPLPINVNGIPTYVMALKDSEGLIKNYAMVNIERYNIAAKGQNLSETQRAYLQAISKSGASYVASDETFGYTVEGTVTRISSEVQDGSTQYYLIIDEDSEKLFTAAYSVSNELSITQPGDVVQISYLDDKNGTVDIIAFDNIKFSTPKSDAQESREELDKDTSVYDSQFNAITEVNPEINEDVWSGLSDEEKAKLIEKYLSGEE